MKSAVSTLLVFVCMFAAGSLFGQQPAPARAQSGADNRSVAAEPAAPATTAQASSQAVVPRLIKFNGVLQDLSGKPIAGPVDVTFSLYSEQAGGSPLWFETQTVQASSRGHYTVLLGAMTPSGVPMELFTGGEARWLGVQVSNLPEQSRVLLVSVPYAMKAGDAETLGGKPASAFMLSSSGSETGSSSTTNTTVVTTAGTNTATTNGTPITQATTQNYLPKFSDNSGTLTNSVIFQGASGVGIGTASPAFPLDLDNNAFAIGPKNSRPGAGGTMRFRDDTGTVRWLFGVPGTAGSQDFFMYNYTNGHAPLYIENGAPSYSFYFKSNGDVGIGTNSPTAKLDVNGTAKISGAVTLSTGVSGNLKINGMGNALVFPDGTVMTSAGTGTSGGTITAVNAGAGLVGGGTAGSVTLYLDTSMVPTFATSSNVFTGDVTANSFTGAFSGTTGIFSTSTGGPVVGATQSGTGPAMQAETTSTASGATAVLGNASSASGNTVGVWGKSASSSGVAVRADNSATTGLALGVYGSSAGDSGVGVEGEATSTTGSAYGVLGTTPSTSGIGVYGTALASTGSTVGVAGDSLSDSGIGVQGSANKLTGDTIGVRGINLSATGVGVSGEASDASGATIGVQGVVNSSAGVAGVFQNNNGGDILLGKQGSNTVFTVDKDGNVMASGTVTGTSISTAGNLSVTAVNGSTALFGASTGGDVVGVVQSGAGTGLSAETTSATSGSTAVLGTASNAAGTNTVGVWGQNSSATGIAVRADNSATTGAALGVYGTTASTSGTAVEGDATEATGSGKGVVGSSAGATGTGVEGDATATTGANFGVRGVTASDTGTGVSGEATSSTGATVGVHGYSNSASGTAGLFENVNGGDILIGKQGSTQVFLVDANGNVTANSFSSLTSTGMISAGTADFSGTNGTEIASVTQEGTGVGLSATSTSTSGGATAIEASASGTSGSTNAIWATNASSDGVAVRADATDTTGANVGVLATSAGTSGTAVRADATATTGNTVGVYGTNASATGIGVRGEATDASGQTLGVYGKSTSSSGMGVEGESTATSGTAFGTYGLVASTSGVGVQGEASAATGTTFGVKGLASSTSGTGVFGQAPAVGVLGTGTGASGVGVKGTVSGDSATAGVFDNTSAVGDLILGSVSGVHKFRVDGSGAVYGSIYQTSGADFAESVDVAGSSSEYQPGDVMVVDPSGRRRMQLSSQPYSTFVAGIYSTKPGMLATPRRMDDPRLAKEVPLAVVGIVPCKVSAENGAIHPGDLLVTSSIPGHAMKGTDRARMLGAIVGKALQPLESGTGVIEVLVTLQ